MQDPPSPHPLDVPTPMSATPYLTAVTVTFRNLRPVLMQEVTSDNARPPSGVTVRFVPVVITSD